MYFWFVGQVAKISASHAEVAGFDSRTNYLIVWSNGGMLRVYKTLVCLTRDTGSIPVTIVYASVMEWQT